MRGIQTVKRKTKHGVKVLYRVQVRTKDFRKDKAFHSYEEAKEFFLASKSITGKDKILLLEERQKEEKREADEFHKSPPLEVYIEAYFRRYVAPKYQKYDRKTPEGKFKLRNETATYSAYRKILDTEICPKPYGFARTNQAVMYALGGNDLGKLVQFRELKIKQITPFVINQLIKVWLEGKKGPDGEFIDKPMKPISVKRYLTHLSNVFGKLKHLDPKLADVRNPTRDYDRDMLKAYEVEEHEPPFRLSPEDRDELIKALTEHPNKQLLPAILLVLETGLRRSELVLLRWDWIHETHIHLPTSKNGKPRDIVLTPAAKAILRGVAKTNEPRVFYEFPSITSFASQFLKLMRKHKLTHIKPHRLRKEFISAFIEKLGRQNSLIIAELLGQSINTVEKKIDELPPESMSFADQSDVLKAVGHSDARVTQRHYFSLLKP
jgi:integrase